MEKALQILLVIMLSSTKFMTAPVTALNIGFGYGQTLLLTTIGGIIGVVFFFYLSGAIVRLTQKRAKASSKNVKKRTFTWKNKLIVRVKRDFGLVGLALLTPTILSIPVGTFLAARYFTDRRKVLSYLFASVVVWSVIISSVVIIF